MKYTALYRFAAICSCVLLTTGIDARGGGHMGGGGHGGGHSYHGGGSYNRGGYYRGGHRGYGYPYGAAAATIGTAALIDAAASNRYVNDDEYDDIDDRYDDDRYEYDND